MALPLRVMIKVYGQFIRVYTANFYYGCQYRSYQRFTDSIMTKLDRLVSVMEDGQWHSTEELVDRVGHRFSATKYTAQKQGYQFDRRREGVRFEYRMVSNPIELAR